MKKQCQQCSKEFIGRADKKFCSLACKNQHHLSIQRPTSDLIRQIDLILHRNHHILNIVMGPKRYKAQLARLELDAMGFNFNHYTGTYLNNEGKTYHYVYDFAWMTFSTQEVLIIKKK